MKREVVNGGQARNLVGFALIKFERLSSENVIDKLMQYRVYLSV